MPNHDTKSGCFQPDHQIIPTPNVVATPAALLSRLSGEYPVIARCQPLKIGIHEALYQALPGIAGRWSATFWPFTVDPVGTSKPSRLLGRATHWTAPRVPWCQRFTVSLQCWRCRVGRRRPRQADAHALSGLAGQQARKPAQGPTPAFGRP